MANQTSKVSLLYFLPKKGVRTLVTDESGERSGRRSDTLTNHVGGALAKVKLLRKIVLRRTTSQKLSFYHRAATKLSLDRALKT